jgi:pimeloyl-ACP methyl ester carboxylesterase
MEARVIELDDGRALAWSEMGDPDGYPVLAFHGTPGSRHQVLIDPTPARQAEVRIIAPDRPGYGLSTYQPHRTLEGWARDVATLADHLGLDRFAVMGTSGGGPHAAACARFLADRVSAAALLSGVGSVAAPGSEAGMMPPNRVFSRLARRAPKANAPVFGLVAMLGRRMPDRAMAMVMKNAPKADVAALEDPLVQAAFRHDLAHASPTTGRAAAQDFGLFAHDWGFRLEDITVPVHVWHADQDVNVPVAHGERQAAAIPGAVLHLLPGEGHLASVDHMDEILRELLASRR